MLFKNISILDEDFNILQDMYVGVLEDKIAYIGNESPSDDYGQVYDGRGKLLMPGFYNTHGHSAMSLMRGYGENMSLQDWLNKLIFPFEDRLDSHSVYWGTLLSMAESLRFGIVSTTDMYYFIDDMYGAIKDSGMKNNLSRAIVHFDDSNPWQLPSMKEMKRTFESYHNSLSGKVKMDVSIHAEYTSNPIAVKAVVEYGKEVGANLHIHASETKLEHEECKQRHGGLTPIQYFNSLNAFELPTTAAHCVWIDDDDIEILKEKNVTVATNPMSNLKLASGVCNVPKLMEKGVNVAIGTDSVASNNSLNFFEEMKTFAVASKMMFNNPAVITPVQTLKAATVNGARSQGRFDCGLLKEGYKADLIVIDVNKPNMHPIHNMVNNLVYSASGSDVVLTMVDGKVLYKDGQYLTIDIEKTMYEAQKATERILAML